MAAHMRVIPAVPRPCQGQRPAALCQRPEVTTESLTCCSLTLLSLTPLSISFSPALVYWILVSRTHATHCCALICRAVYRRPQPMHHPEPIDRCEMDLREMELEMDRHRPTNRPLVRSCSPSRSASPASNRSSDSLPLTPRQCGARHGTRVRKSNDGHRVAQSYDHEHHRVPA